MKLEKTLLSILFVITIISLALVCIIAINYSYSLASVIESTIAITIILAAAVLLWSYHHRSNPRWNAASVSTAIIVGIALGLLWMVEISINNFIAPPLPMRDIIDNIFWAVIALTILFFSIAQTYQTGSIARASQFGIWSGFTSGLLACLMGLSVVVFGMRFIVTDPLNILEWRVRGANSQNPTMAAYFAFETLAGAFLHLIILGIGMGGLLGIVGGILGKGLKEVWHWVRGAC